MPMRAHSRSVSEITDILEAIVVGKALEIAIVREVGDARGQASVSIYFARSA